MPTCNVVLNRAHFNSLEKSMATVRTPVNERWTDETDDKTTGPEQNIQNRLRRSERKRKRNDGIDVIKPPPKRWAKNAAGDLTIDQIVQRPKRTIRPINKRTKNKLNALMPSLHQHQLLWSYVRGFPYWPAVLEQILPNGKYKVHFFGDYTRADVTRRCILDYYEGFGQFSCNFGNIKLQKAVEEAKYFLFGNNDTSECYVCKILEYKKKYNKEIMGKKLNVQ